MMRKIEMLGYKLHDGRRGWLLAFLGAAMLNIAYRENRRLYQEALADACGDGRQR